MQMFKPFISAGLLLIPMLSWGQQQPSISSDNKVTLTVKANSGATVKVVGQLNGTMSNNNGTYTWTSGKLSNGIYVYNISVNGALVTDKMNLFQCRLDGHQANVITIGNTNWTWVMNQYHGSMHQTWVNNGSNNRKMVQVYTPWDYGTEANKNKKFPVLYMLHGPVANETGCFEHTLVNRLMDNLVANSKCVPFIIVIPYWNATEAELTSIVKPVIEKGYRVDTGKTYIDKLAGSKHDINEWGKHVESLFPTLFK